MIMISSALKTWPNFFQTLCHLRPLSSVLIHVVSQKWWKLYRPFGREYWQDWDGHDRVRSFLCLTTSFFQLFAGLIQWRTSLTAWFSQWMWMHFLFGWLISYANNRACHSKCISARYAEADLNKGESVCIDRCVGKYHEVQKKVGEKLQGRGANASPGATGGFSSLWTTTHCFEW